MNPSTLFSASRIGRVALVAAVLCAASAQAAQNCISNGDFELPNAGSNFGYSYSSNNNGRPTDWTLSPSGRNGRVNEVSRFGVLDLMGYHSLFLERRKGDGSSGVTEAKQTLTIPAPGKYRLQLNYCEWDPVNDYGEITALAQLIHPGGAVTNSLKSFKPGTPKYGLEGIGAFMADSVALTAYGAGNDYTLRFSSSDATSKQYAYCIIDNVSFTLRTLVLGANEMFTSVLGLAPYNMELGADSTLTYTPTTATAEILEGKVTFAAGAKIVFDMASATAGAYVLRTGGFVLPDGASDLLAFIDIANAGDYALSLIEDGRTVLVSKADAVTSATWTGGGDLAVLLDAANWSAVPDASTFTITLGAAADWRGLGALAVSPAATIDLNGNALKLSGLTPAEFTGAAITNSASGAAAALTIDVPAGATNENKTVAILGNIRLMKEGAGGFKATKIDQTYWGGTAVNGGTLIAGTHGKFRPFGAPERNLIANGDFEANGLNDTTSYAYSQNISGGLVGWETASSYTGLYNAYFYWTRDGGVNNIHDPQYEWYKFALFLSNERWVQQTFHVAEPGTYRLYFEHGPWFGGGNYGSCNTPVILSHPGETNLLTNVKPAQEVGYRQFFTDVEITSADDYTLRFDTTQVGGNLYIIIDNLSFVRTCEIAVGEGATLDMNGREGCGLYSIVVAGGTLKNDCGDVSANRIGFADVTLTDDAALSMQKSYALSGYGNALATLDLGGQTLTVTKATSKSLFLRDAEIKNGTLVLPGNGWLQTDGNGADASTVDFEVTSALQIDAPLTVRNYTSRYTANNNAGTAALNVLGTFTPETAYFYGCTMQDGSTIDLSGKSGAWSTASSFTGGKRVVDYAPNATVNIEVGARALAIGDKVVSWTAKPPVEDNVLFAFVRNGTVSETHAFAVQDDGLYVKRAAEPVYATYDVANDAWKFYTESDAEIADWNEGVTGNMQVRFATYAEYAALAATNLTPSAFVLTGDLALPAGAGEADMTAFPFDFPANMTIDLNGRTVKLHEAMMGGTKPFTVTSSVAGGVLVAEVADAADTVNNTSMTIAGPVKLLKAGTGTFTASKANQTYTGGTEVTNGVLKCGINGYASSNTWPFGTKQELLENGSFEKDANAGWSGAVGWTRYSASGNNWIGVQAAGSSYCHKDLPVGKFALIIGNKVGKGISYVEQELSLTAGIYRYSFKHAKLSGRDGNTTDVLLMHDGDEDRVLATVTPETTNVFATCSGFVRIDVGGTYKFRICARKQTSTVDLYNVFDNISFTFIPEVKLTGADAVLDMNGKYWLYDNFYVLNGGTMRNTGGNPGDSRSKIQYVGLSRDSSFDFASTYGVHGESALPALVDMGGYTLNATVGNGQAFWLNSTVMTGEGRVVIPATTGTLTISDQGGRHIGLAATNVDFSVGCALNLTAPMDVGGYEALYEGTANTGTAALNVFGTFRPVTSNYYGCVLQDGATLDLSGWQGEWPWDVTSAFTTGNATVTFADGATIKVKRGAKGGKIVSWTEKPSNFDTLTFVRDPSDDRNYRIVKKDDGVYIVNGLAIIVR